MAEEKVIQLHSYSPHGELTDLNDEVIPSRHFQALGDDKRFLNVGCKEKGVKFEMEEIIDENNSKDVVLKSSDKPHEDFINAMKNLVPLVRYILDFPDSYATYSLNIGSVSFSYSKNEIKGVVISGWINLDTTNSAFFFNTPYMPYERPSQGSDMPIVPDFGIRALNLLEKEAASYINGKRAQLDMFAGDDNQG